MDFVGQANYEVLASILYVIEALICFSIGFCLQDFQFMMQTYCLVGGVTGLLLLPDSKYWPVSWLFNKNPVKWLPPLNPHDAPPPPPSILEKLMRLFGLSSRSDKPKETGNTRQHNKKR